MPITIDTAGLDRKIAQVAQFVAREPRLKAAVGQIVHGEVLQNFDAGGRPRRWRRNRPSTLRGKRPETRPLVGRNGRPSSLEQSRIIVRQNEVEIRSIPQARAYARIHNVGGRAGRGLRTQIPARRHRPSAATGLRRDTRTRIGRTIKRGVRDRFGGAA